MNALLTQMQARMAMYQRIRQFFSQRNVAEVETPILSPYGSTDVHIDSFVTQWEAQRLYLHTSPEFAMKMLLAEGVGDCFQIAKVFRHETAGRNHRPEFTMLEWYRVGFDLSALIDEVAALVRLLIPAVADLPMERLSYADAFSRIGVDPHGDSLAAIKHTAETLSGYRPQLADDRDEWLDFLLVTQIEAQLGDNQLTFLTHYPASMAALAKRSINADGFAVAERFELYYRGIELANGFDELTDADEQLARFEADNRARAALGKPTVALDEDLIAALQRGMPDCAGVALGLDRILMLAQGRTRLDDMMAFPAPKI